MLRDQRFSTALPTHPLSLHGQDGCQLNRLGTFPRHSEELGEDRKEEWKIKTSDRRVSLKTRAGDGDKTSRKDQ